MAAGEAAGHEFDVERLRETMALKLSVPADVLQLTGPCRHALSLLPQLNELPPSVKAHVHRECSEERRIEALYQREVLGEAACPDPPAPPPSAPPLRTTCSMCEDEYEGPPDEYSHSSVVMLPGWHVRCRQHCWRQAVRVEPGRTLALIPRAEGSVLWCPACCRGLCWLPEQLNSGDMAEWLPPAVREAVLHWPVPTDSVTAAGVSLEKDERSAVVLLAQLAAEAHQWRRADLVNAKKPVRRIFVPAAGLDPAGSSTEWTGKFYDGVLTSACALPHARAVRVGAAGDEFAEVILDEFGPPEHSSSRGKDAVFGYAIRADPDDGDAAMPAHQRLALLSELPIRYRLQVRAVWLQDCDRWADCVVPHCGGGPSEERRSGEEAPADWHTDAVGDLDEDTESEGDGAQPEQHAGSTPVMDDESERKIAEWVQFFFDAYMIALGIVQAGAVAESAAAGSM
eukprot:TRINITY_DN9137_c1_g2_i1.p1 TRINITY_DN9137_c1_g2~~TRINITY_DN9137_c1_g2_i1.p1  ORF type:complete len:455 (+),score=97.44 TRINITY_DN9137_c1_g2_i1:66-1430(+)